MKEIGKPLVAQIYVDSGERLYLITFMMSPDELHDFFLIDS